MLRKLLMTTTLILGTGAAAAWAQSTKPVPPAPEAAQAKPMEDCMPTMMDMGFESMGGMGHGRGMQRMQNMLQAIDKDGDGNVSKDEAKSFPMSKFDLVDANRDGTVTPEEIDAHIMQMAQRLRAMMIGKLDANADGKISRDEASKAVDVGFERMDSNKDGKLNRGEIREKGREAMERRHKEREDKKAQ